MPLRIPQWSPTAIGCLAGSLLLALAPRCPGQADVPVSGGITAFVNSQGFLDYARPTAPTPDARAVLPKLIVGADRVAEPLEAMRPDQTRGQRVELNWDLLDALGADVPLRAEIPLFDGAAYELVFVKGEQRGPGRYTWFGQIAGVAASDFILVREIDAVELIVRDYKHRASYQINSVFNGHEKPLSHALREVGTPLPDAATAIPAAPFGGGHGSIGGHPSGFGPRGPGCGVTDPFDIIDVCFETTANLNANFAQSQMKAQANALVADFNLRSNNSGCGVTMRVAYVAIGAMSSYNEVGPVADTNAMRNNASVQNTRNLVRADLVVLLRQGGGTAYITPFDVSQLIPINGFAACNYGDSRGFSRAIGFSFGACEDESVPCNSGMPNPRGYVGSCQQFLFPFCREYYYDTMAIFRDNGCGFDAMIPYYSNPAVTYVTSGICSNNTALGNSISNVAQLMVNNRAQISQYSIGSSQAWADSLGSSNGNGTFDNPYRSVRVAVNAVQGGVACGSVIVAGARSGSGSPGVGGLFEETANNNGQPVLLSNPCVITMQGSFPALIR